MKVSTDQEYTSVACNRNPEIVDWNNEGIIVYGATNAVIIYDTKIQGKDPLTVLSHHRSKVNSVKWLCKYDNTCSELVSCSADKTAVIWSLVDGIWKVTSILSGHTDGVTNVYGVYVDDSDLIVYTTSIDSTVRVWERRNGEIELKHTIPLNSGLCLTLCAHLLRPVNKPMLFCALDDFKIHVFEGESYQRVHSLVGHEDWVRGLDILDIDDKTIMLASASQDTYIRLWRIQRYEEQDSSAHIRVEQKVFLAHGLSWSVKLEAVLAGHEGWVYGVQWHPCSVDKETGKRSPVYRLLSSSLDKTLIVWQPEGGAGGGGGAWAERVRVGEVGGSGLGFYGARFGPRGRALAGHGYNGSLHVWTLNEESGEWEPTPAVGGHFAPVEDVRWEPRRARYLLSAAADQTARLHAAWRRRPGCREWHEIARPQVHGYDMWSLAPLSAAVFASAADEKVVRVFRATGNFAHNFRNIVGEALLDGRDHGGPGAEGASVPSLGLSNKAVYGDGDPGGQDEGDLYFTPVDLTAPPTEETLVQNTLWPETHKLYGHGSEVRALAASPDGALLASAARAAAADHAAVLLWETAGWQQIQRLVSHRLTVTQLAFSPDSRRLVSVSRDRRWTLYRRRQGSNLFDVAAASDKSNGVHTRILWCCAWAHDGAVFATGSREGKVCVWSQTDRTSESSLGEYGLAGSPLPAPAAVTALDFAPGLRLGRRVLAAGLETGVIRIHSLTVRDHRWELLHEMDNSAAHHLAVRRLAFRPRLVEGETGAGGEETGASGGETGTSGGEMGAGEGETGAGEGEMGAVKGEVEEAGALQLASAGADHLVRIHNLYITS